MEEDYQADEWSTQFCMPCVQGASPHSSTFAVILCPVSALNVCRRVGGDEITADGRLHIRVIGNESAVQYVVRIHDEGEGNDEERVLFECESQKGSLLRNGIALMINATSITISDRPSSEGTHHMCIELAVPWDIDDHRRHHADDAHGHTCSHRTSMTLLIRLDVPTGPSRHVNARHRSISISLGCVVDYSRDGLLDVQLEYVDKFQPLCS